jgi:hypothetical protein
MIEKVFGVSPFCLPGRLGSRFYEEKKPATRRFLMRPGAWDMDILF